jgi:transglutaminase-like putative cysteine protease
VVNRLFQVVIAIFLWIPIFMGMTGVAVAQEIPEQESSFATSYDVSYEIGADGVTTVTEKITLKNLTSRYYATEFSLTIGATQVSDVTATDDSGPLEVKQEKKDTSTTISVKFNQQVAGEGKTLPWTLKFKSKDFATSLGKIWEVSIPKVVTTTHLESYNVTISVPASFGQPTQISPTPKTQTASFDRLFLTYDKDSLKDSGVSANFGTFQLFDFDLSYHLENPNLVPAITSIALPPDTAYQDVIYSRIDPKPVNVTVDSDGNFLAWYRLTRGQKLDIKAVGSAKLYANSKVKTPTLSEDNKKNYLTAAKYWEKDNPAINTTLTEIFKDGTPGSNYEKAKMIHRYVVGALKYDSSRLLNSSIERFGAVTALNNSEAAVCMEFTDLFIALARAAGIPARELDGYAYTANPELRPLSLSRDILHAWPEFYDDTRGWIMIDPTWENTTNGVDYFSKLDLNHFVFAVKGHSSETPAPAGSYKFSGVNSQDVKVNFSENDFLGKPQLDIKIESADPLLAGFPSKIKVIITNVGNSIAPSSTLNIVADKLTILDGKDKSVAPIPAFGHAEFELNVRTKNLVESYDDMVTVTVDGQEYQQTIKVRPLFLFKGFPYILGGVLSLIFAVYLVILGVILFRRRRLVSKSTKK